MKKHLFLAALLCAALSASAQNSLQSALPLLQKNNRTAAENQRVLQIFRSSKDPDTVFAAGASLVKNPPSKAQEPALFNLVLKNDDALKQTFAAVIITAMGAVYDELTPVLQNALQSKDLVLRSYAAGAYGIINPNDQNYALDVVRLYAYDPAFAVRSLNVLTDDTKAQLKYLKQAASSADDNTRAAAAAWLTSLHSEGAAKQLLKMAKTETVPSVQSQIATGLAKNRAYTLAAVANAARAAAYMAGVLSNPDAFTYTSDRAFDTGLLKSLIPQLKVLVQTGDENVRIYAQNALTQIEKLMN